MIVPAFLLGFAQVARDFGIYVIEVVDSCCLENEERESQATRPTRSTEHLRRFHMNER